MPGDPPQLMAELGLQPGLFLFQWQLWELGNALSLSLVAPPRSLAITGGEGFIKLTPVR